MVDEQVGRLHLNSCAGIPDVEVKKLEWLDYGIAVCGCVAKEEARIIAEDIFHTYDVRTELVKSFGIQAYCCHPLKIQDRLIGTLSFGTKTRPCFTPDEVELMRTVANQVAIAMVRVKSMEELRISKDNLEISVRERTADLEILTHSLKEKIAERRHAEETAKRERQRLYDVLETLPVYVILLTKDHYIPFANRFFRERFGESHGRRCYEYLFEREEPCEVCETYTVLNTKKPHYWEWIGPDGRNYDIFDFPFTDTDGSLLIMEVGIDITNQRRVEESLKRTHHYTRSLIEASIDPLVTISADGKITDVNKATEEVTGIAREKIIGTDFSDYFTEPEKARAGYEEVFSKSFVKDYPLAIRHVSGRIINVLYNATTYVGDNGEVQGVFAAARDVTELRRVQDTLRKSYDQLERHVEERTIKLKERTDQLEAANKELESFSYSVSHDLRAPLRAIDGFSRMILKKNGDKFDGDTLEKFNIIRSNSQMMGQLIDGLLAFSRLGKKDLTISRLDMKSLIQDVWKELLMI